MCYNVEERKQSHSLCKLQAHKKWPAQESVYHGRCSSDLENNTREKKDMENM
jgi:hypothetical protein